MYHVDLVRTLTEAVQQFADGIQPCAVLAFVQLNVQSHVEVHSRAIDREVQRAKRRRCDLHLMVDHIRFPLE